MKKYIYLFITLAIFNGCGGNNGNQNTINSNNDSTNNEPKGQFLDSIVIGLDYTTNTINGITDNDGYFVYNKNDKNITFKVGNLVLGSVDLNKTHAGKFYPADLAGVDVNSTTDNNVIKIIRFLQSLDNDNNPDNGIYITDNIKNQIDNVLDNNSTYKKNLLDNNISVIKNLIEKLNKKFVLERVAREHYAKTLISQGFTPTKMPFITVWEVSGDDKNITIPVNPNYDYNYTVDWGDGNISYDLNNTITHTYKNEGNNTVKISGKFPAIYLNNDGKDLYDDYNYQGNADKLIEIKKWGDIEWKSFEQAFSGDEQLIVTSTDTPNLKNVKNLSYIFADNITKIFTNDTIKYWDTSTITNMEGCFGAFGADYDDNYIGRFNSDISDWNVSNVTNMKNMFYNAALFNQPLDKWNVSNVTNLESMFYNACSFNQPLNNWNVSNVTNMVSVFMYASAFNQPLNSWNVSNVTNMEAMFYSADSFNQPLDKWDVSHVTNMKNMFANAGSFDQNISDWNVSSVTNHDHFADHCPIDGTDKMPHFKN